MVPAEQAPSGGPKRLPRGTLGSEVILDAALRLLDAEGAAALTMPRLGRELGASSTAVYRHFPSRDDVVLGVADRLIGEALERFQPAESWVETLRDLALRFWTTCEGHPAAASMTYMRTTRRPHEVEAVEAILGAVLAAGWQGREALLQYRAYASFVLSLAGAGAAFASLAKEERVGDESAWPRVYGRLGERRHPNVAAMAAYMSEQVSAREVFEHQVDLYLQSMVMQAPRGGRPSGPSA